MKSKCSFCNKEFEGDLNFCPHCGKPIAKENKLITCSKCGFSYKSDFSFCPKCGIPKEQVKKTINEPVNKQVAAPIAKPIKEELVLEEKVKPEVFKEEKKVEKVQQVKIEKDIEEKPIVIAKDTTSTSLPNTNSASKSNNLNTNDDKEFLSNLGTKLTKYLNIKIFGNAIYLVTCILFLFVPVIYFNVNINGKIEQIYYSYFDYSVIGIKEMIEIFKTSFGFEFLLDYMIAIVGIGFLGLTISSIKWIVKACRNKKNISKFTNDKYRFTNKYLDTSSMDEYVKKDKFDKQNDEKDITGKSIFLWNILNPIILIAISGICFYFNKGKIGLTIVIPSIFLVIYFIVGCTQRILMKKINKEIYDYKDYKSGKKKVNR